MAQEHLIQTPWEPEFAQRVEIPRPYVAKVVCPHGGGLNNETWNTADYNVVGTPDNLRKNAKGFISSWGLTGEFERHVHAMPDVPHDPILMLWKPDLSLDSGE